MQKTIEAETEEEAISLYNRGHYKDSDYDIDDMTYDHEFSDIEETENTKVKQNTLPTKVHNMMVSERIAKYWQSIQSKTNHQCQAINLW